MNAELVQGFRLARERTRLGSRSFYFASHLLDGPRRAGAYALYAFLREADDAADSPGTPDARSASVRRVRGALERAYSGKPNSALEHALSSAVQTFGLPREPLEELVAVVGAEVERVRVATWSELGRYCHGVASTVGLAMAPLLGAPKGFEREAAALGHAMQLTNILRDVREDVLNDRVYLPAEALRAAGITELDLARGRVDDRWRALASQVATRANEAYDAAEPGIRAIAPWRSRTTVRLMRASYREILREIERRAFDVFRERVVISTSRKLWLATRVIAGADPAAPGAR